MNGGRSNAPAWWINWSGNQSCYPQRIEQPADEDSLVEVIRRSPNSIRVCGAGHSFSPLVPTDATMLSLAKLSGIHWVDGEKKQVVCGCGVTIHDLGPELQKHGLALRNQGDVDAQTIAGACSTGTHGTGIGFGCLASDVVGLRMVTATGAIVTCDLEDNSDLFDAVRVSLGSMGILTQLKLQCQTSYCLRERLSTMSLEECLARSDDLASGNRHFEFFHFPFADRVLVKLTNEANSPHGSSSGDQREDKAFGWICSIASRFPAFNPMLQRIMMRCYPGRERCDWSFRVFPSARTVRFNEMEYEVPAESGVPCFREIVGALRRQRSRNFFPVEFRRVQGDSLWLSPFYERDSVSISVHQHHQLPYQELFDSIEPIFWRYAGRPHWGKLHSLTARRLRALYPRWNDFVELRQQLDPNGKFLNPYLKKVFESED